MMKTGVFKAIILGLIICFALSAGCAKLPEENGSTFVSSGSDDEPSGTTGEEVIQVTLSTPIPTTEPTEKPEYSSLPDADGSGPQYSVIYFKEDELRYNVIPFDFELIQPPLVFEYELDIATIDSVKAGSSSYGDKSDYSYSITVPNPNAWYTISVYDSETSEIIDSKELAQFAETSESGSFKIYQAGKLHIEISGNLLTANTTVKVPSENLE